MQLALQRQCHPEVLLAVLEHAPEQARTCPPDAYVALAQVYPDQARTIASVIHTAFKERVTSWWSRSHTEQGGGVPGFVSPWAKARELRAFFTKWVESPLTQHGIGLNNLRRSLTLAPATSQWTRRPFLPRRSRGGTEGELVFSSDEEEEQDMNGVGGARHATGQKVAALNALDSVQPRHNNPHVPPHRHHGHQTVVPMSTLGPTKRTRRPRQKSKKCNSASKPWSDHFEVAVVWPAVGVTKDFLRAEIQQVLRDAAHAAKASAVSPIGTIHTPRRASSSAAEGSSSFLPSLVDAMTVGLRAVYGPVAAELSVPSQHVQV